MNALASVIRNRNLALVFAGRLVSSGGDFAYKVALSVAIYHYGGKPLYIGLLWVAMLIPSLVLGPISGHWADRLGYRRAMIIADVSRAILVALLPLVLNGTTWVLAYPLVFLITGFSTLFSPGSIGIIPSLVESPDDQLTANALMEQAGGIAIIVGSALGGIGAGAGLVNLLLFADAATFGLSALTLALVRPRAAAVEHDEPAEEEEIGSGMFGGFQLLAGRPLLVFTAVVMAFPEFVSGSTVVWFVPFSLNNLHLGNAGVGFLYAAIGAGAVVGGVVAAVVGSNFRLTQLLAGSVALNGAACALFGATNIGLVALTFILVLGLAETVEYAAYGTLIQQAAPASMIGKVAGTLDSILFAAMLLGNIASGLLASAFGLAPSIVGLGAITAIAAGLAYLNLRIRTAGQPEPEDLARIPGFSDVSDAVRQWAIRRMLREQFVPGAVIMRQGDVGDKFYMISKGTVQVEITSGEQSLSRELGPGEFFGEIALLHNVPRTATVRALSPLTAYSLTREDFEELQSRAAQFKQSLLETATARMQEDINFRTALDPLRS